ncbi:hypothetical protein [Clostridium oceanicum]|uniref:Uncharacterized protein n=1 Tax=Clostridium oceanicum TaxID=1543 RepID=A0ABN1JQ66_9CLOT
MKNNSSNSLNLAKGGIFTALSFLCIYLSSILPVNKLYLLSMACALITISVVYTDIKNGFLVYLASSILSIMLIGLGRVVVISYIIFFGSYGLIKYYIEKLNKLTLEIILKFIFFNICLVIMFLIYKFFIPSIPLIDKYLWIYILVGQIVFFIFDYILTLFIFYVEKHFIKKLK